MGYVHIEVNDPWEAEKRRRFYKNLVFGILGLLVIVSVAVLLYRLNIDREPPVVNLISPKEGQVLQQNKIYFSYNASEPVKNCSVYLNDALIEQTENVTVAPGKNTWKVSCIDNYKNKGVSALTKFWVLTPLRLTKISDVEAPDLESGLLVLYENPDKKTLGEEVYNILPREGGEEKKANLDGGILGISLWGKTHLNKQEVTIKSGKETYTIYLPELEGLTGEYVLYLSEDGSTFHSYKSHDYNVSSNNGQNISDLSWQEALTLEHAARLTGE
ncbi:hypothetical protein HYV79_03005 [Candidatus Woesearchaeota archaeon]|nr:hypothetical protein [Candidatus Woesearchaeota archaeon]